MEHSFVVRRPGSGCGSDTRNLGPVDLKEATQGARRPSLLKANAGQVREAPNQDGSKNREDTRGLLPSSERTPTLRGSIASRIAIS